MTLHPPARLAAGRVVLRRPAPADAARTAATLAENIDHLIGWMAWVPTAAVTEAGQLERLRENDAAWEAGTGYLYLLLSADESEHYGMLGLHRRIGPGALEIGYWVAKAHEGNGYITEAVALLTDAALALADVERVEIHCDAANTRSAAIPARVGYVLERVDDKPLTAPLETGRDVIWVRTRPTVSS
ncbi:MAG TPA: GNAT family N-acetyltransferase [Mycobacteriales bacterium]|nr:GNAT family N-acetyltransferase [Mycobacteriales bacterium]